MADVAEPSSKEQITFTVEADAGQSKVPLEVRTRRMLKECLRRHGLRCVDLWSGGRQADDAASQRAPR